MKTSIIGILALLSFSILVACSSADKAESDTAEGSFQIAQRLEESNRLEDAIRAYTDVKNRFPYSRYAAKADLKVADLHFQREHFPEAQVAYQLFREFHPRHPQSDYVTYRLAKSHYKQLPSTIDRDLSAARDAIRYFEEVIRSFPQSDYREKAEEKKREVEEMLAEKELYIAEFYFKRRSWTSALGRFDGLIRRFPDSRFAVTAYKGAALSAHRLGQQAEAKRFFSQMQNRFPASDETRSVERELKR